MALETLANHVFSQLLRNHTVGDGQLTVFDASGFLVGTRLSVIRGVGQTSEQILFIANVTSITGNVITLGSFLENTEDQQAVIGDYVQLRSTAGQWNDMVSAITGATTPSITIGNPIVSGTGGCVLYQSGSNSLAEDSGLTYNGSTHTLSASALALTTPLPIADGGTGHNTATAALTALLPTQTGNSGKTLTTDGMAASWSASSGGVSIGDEVSGGTVKGLLYVDGSGNLSDSGPTWDGSILATAGKAMVGTSGAGSVWGAGIEIYAPSVYGLYVSSSANPFYGLLMSSSNAGHIIRAYNASLDIVSDVGLSFVSGGDYATTAFDHTITAPLTSDAGNGPCRLSRYMATWSPNSSAYGFTALEFDITVNQTGTSTGSYTGLSIDVTETSALGTDNKLVDFSVGGQSKFSVDSHGAVTIGNSVTSGRPTVTAVGTQWYDSTLEKPIWWSGSAWKDAMGNTV